MERELGEKSYKPGKFEYNVIYDVMANDEYRSLFARKIPGNILLSAYYEPMTVRELSIEMGISSVYMEDELALLERYDLIKSVGELKYQTNLIIFTEDFMKELYKTLDKNYVSKIGEVIGLIKDALPEIRKIGFRGCELADNNLLWTFYMLTLFNGSGITDKEPRPDNDYIKTIDLLKPAIDKMGGLFEEIADATCKIMSSHAPKFMAENIKAIVYNTLPFSIMGWYGAAALNSGAIEKPGNDDIVSVCGYIG